MVRMLYATTYFPLQSLFSRKVHRVDVNFVHRGSCYANSNTKVAIPKVSGYHSYSDISSSETKSFRSLCELSKRSKTSQGRA